MLLAFLQACVTHYQNRQVVPIEPRDPYPFQDWIDLFSDKGYTKTSENKCRNKTTTIKCLTFSLNALILIVFFSFTVLSFNIFLFSLF